MNKSYFLRLFGYWLTLMVFWHGVYFVIWREDVGTVKSWWLSKWLQEV